MSDDQHELLKRIAEALERLAPPLAALPDFAASDAFIWSCEADTLRPVPHVNRVETSLLKGIDRVRDILHDNTERFANKLPANNALLWGARGMGKSSLVKALHHDITKAHNHQLKLIEIHREDIESLPRLMTLIGARNERFIIFCDDLSFDHNDTSYKSLKAMLDGGIEGRPENVVLYATSNRRHLLPRDMIENEQGSAINPSDAVQEKTSLSDRFGLWLGFYNCTQTDYLEMIDAYAKHYLKAIPDDLHHQALEWATTRGARSGRVAWQFTQDLAGRTGTILKE